MARAFYRADGYAHRHVATCNYGSNEHYEHRSHRVRGTVQIDDPDDSKLYIYRLKRADSPDFKRWFEGTFDRRGVRVKGKFPLYYVVRD